MPRGRLRKEWVWGKLRGPSIYKLSSISGRAETVNVVPFCLRGGGFTKTSSEVLGWLKGAEAPEKPW